MATIEVLTQKEKDKLEVDIQNCLQVLYRLENITRYEEKVISNCIDFLQDLKLSVIYENEVLNND